MGDATTTQAGTQEIPQYLQDYIKKMLASAAGYAYAPAPTMTPEQQAAWNQMTQGMKYNVMPTDPGGSQWWGAFAGLDKSQVEANAKNQVPNANNSFYTDPSTRTPYNPTPQSFVYQNPDAVTSLHNDFNNTYKPAADPWAQDQFKPLPAPNPGGTQIDPKQFARDIKGSTIGAVGGSGSGLPLYPSGPGGSGMPGPQNPWYPGAPGWGPSQPTSYGQPVDPKTGSTTGGLGPGLPGGGVPSAPAAPAAPEGPKWGGSSTEPVWSDGKQVDPRSRGQEIGDNGLPFFLTPPKNSWITDPQIGNSYTGVSQSGNPMQWASQEGADFVKEQIKRLTGQDVAVSEGSRGGGPYSWLPSLEIKGAAGNYADSGAGLEPRQPDRLNVGALANLYAQYSKQEADRMLAEALNNIGIKASTEGQKYAIGNSGNTGLGAPTVHGEMTDAVKAAGQALMTGQGDLAAANKTYYDWYNNVKPEEKPAAPASTATPPAKVEELVVPPVVETTGTPGVSRGVSVTGGRSVSVSSPGRSSPFTEDWKLPTDPSEDEDNRTGRQVSKYAEGGILHFAEGGVSPETTSSNSFSQRPPWWQQWQGGQFDAGGGVFRTPEWASSTPGTAQTSLNIGEPVPNPQRIRSLWDNGGIFSREYPQAGPAPMGGPGMQRPGPYDPSASGVTGAIPPSSVGGGVQIGVPEWMSDPNVMGMQYSAPGASPTDASQTGGNPFVPTPADGPVSRPGPYDPSNPGPTGAIPPSWGASPTDASQTGQNPFVPPTMLMGGRDMGRGPYDPTSTGISGATPPSLAGGNPGPRLMGGRDMGRGPYDPTSTGISGAIPQSWAGGGNTFQSQPQTPATAAPPVWQVPPKNLDQAQSAVGVSPTDASMSGANPYVPGAGIASSGSAGSSSGSIIGETTPGTGATSGVGLGYGSMQDTEPIDYSGYGSTAQAPADSGPASSPFAMNEFNSPGAAAYQQAHPAPKFKEGGILRLLEGGTADQPTGSGSGAGGGTAGATGGVNPNSVYGDLVGGYTPYPGQQVATPGTLTNNYYAGVARNTESLTNPYSNLINPTDVSNTSLNYLLNLFQDPQMAISNNIRGVYNTQIGNNYTPNMYTPSSYNGNSLTGGAQNQLMGYAQNGGGGYQNIDVNQLLSLVGSYNGGGMAIPSANIQNITAPTLAAAPTVNAPQLGTLANVNAPSMGDIAAFQAPTVAAASQVSAPGAASAGTLSGNWNVQAGPAANAKSWIDPGIAQAYMNPYQMAVTEQEKALAKQQRAENQAKISADAVKAGAFGGSRDAVMNAIADRELSRALSQMDATGLNNAWLSGQQQFNQDDARSIQAQIANQQALTDAAKATAGYGLQAGIANQQAGLSAQQMSGDWALKAGMANADAANQAAIASAQFGTQAGIANQQTQAELAKSRATLEMQAALGNQSAQAELMKMQGQLGLQAALGNQSAAVSTNQAQAQMQAAIAQANQQAQAQAAVAQMNAAAQASVASQNAAVQMAQLRGNMGLQGMLANQQGYNQSQDRALQALTAGGNMAAQAGLGAAQLNEQSRQFGAGLTDAGFQRTQQFDLDTAAQNANIQNQIVNSNLNAAGLQGNTAAGMMGASTQQQSLINQMLAQLQGAGSQMDATQQNNLNVLYQNWANQQQYPMQMLNFLAGLSSGQPYSTSSYQQATQTQPSNWLSQILGLGTAGLGAYTASKNG